MPLINFIQCLMVWIDEELDRIDPMKQIAHQLQQNGPTRVTFKFLRPGSEIRVFRREILYVHGGPPYRDWQIAHGYESGGEFSFLTTQKRNSYVIYHEDYQIFSTEFIVSTDPMELLITQVEERDWIE